mmetsp:Transcript_1328/g.2980  ORF Transcript_1328/g.2980 Transcript_1328/m.2980 type:complete len:207 (+) Transcript_1328:833-1453(+)
MQKLTVSFGSPNEIAHVRHKRKTMKGWMTFSNQAEAEQSVKDLKVFGASRTQLPQRSPLAVANRFQKVMPIIICKATLHVKVRQSDALNLCDAPPFRVKQAPAFPIIQVEPMSHQRTLLQFSNTKGFPSSIGGPGDAQLGEGRFDAPQLRLRCRRGSRVSGDVGDIGLAMEKSQPIGGILGTLPFSRGTQRLPGGQRLQRTKRQHL